MDKRRLKDKKLYLCYTSVSENKNGITLIALVISIIVMLILAGVSLNATIGENGIMTQAKNATYMQGIATLEEYLQSEYVKYYDEADEYTNKVELLVNKISNLCLKDGTKNYIIYNGKMYYLLNKQALPEEIRKQLRGGDTTDYLSYIRLKDVYGITEDLRVYYCSEGTDNVLGTLNTSELDPNTPLVKVNTDNEVKSAISEALSKLGVEVGENGVTVGDASKIKDLELDGSNYNITSISALSEISTLKTLTLSNVTLDNLDGLENCTLLTGIYFKNCKINNYTKISTAWNLQYLYLYLPPTMSETDANTQVEKLGEGLANATEIKNLEYFGISGTTDFFEKQHIYDTKDENTKFCVEKYSSNSISNFSNSESLKNVASNIKEKIKYMYLPCNSISSMDFLEGYKNIYELDIMYNKKLQNLNGLQNHNTLKYLGVQKCDISDISDLSTVSSLLIISLHSNKNLNNLVGIENNVSLYKLLVQNCNLIDISSLKSLLNLSYVDLQNNLSLTNVSYIKNCIKLNTLYLAGNENMQVNTVQEIESIIKQCGNNYSLPNKYLKYFTTVTTYDYANSELNDYSEEINALKDRTNIKFLRLNSNINLGKSRIGMHLKMGSLLKSDLNKIEKNLDLSTEETAIINEWKTYSENELSNLSETQIVSTEQENDIYFRYLLSTLTGLEQLSIENISNITKLDFLNSFADDNNFGELDLRGTIITDLSILETKGKKLYALAVSNNEIDFSKIQNVLNNFYFNTNSSAGNYRVTTITGKTIVNGNNKGIMIYDENMDFSKCDKVKYFVSNMQSVYDQKKVGIVVDLTGMTSLINANMLGTRIHWILPSNLTVASVYASSTADFSKCNKLTYVSISWQGTTYTERCLSTLGNSPLIEIDIGYSNNDLNLLDKYLVKAKETLEKIDVKGINGNNRNPGCSGTFEDLKDFKNLKEVFGNYGCNDSILNGVENLTNLTTLQLQGCDISDLTGISKLSKLENLELSNNKISDISELSDLKNLKKILLNKNSISDLIPLEKIITNGSIKLTELDLSDNLLQTTTLTGHNNVNTLIKLHDAGLKTLNISGNNFTAGSTDKLKSLDWKSYKE